MPRLTPYAAQEIAMVSSTPAGSGFPIGLIPGALPSDQASRQTLKTTAVRLPFGHTQFTCLVMSNRAPIDSGNRHIRCSRGGQRRAKPVVCSSSAATDDFAHPVDFM